MEMPAASQRNKTRLLLQRHAASADVFVSRDYIMILHRSVAIDLFALAFQRGHFLCRRYPPVLSGASAVPNGGLFEETSEQPSVYVSRWTETAVENRHAIFSHFRDGGRRSGLGFPLSVVTRFIELDYLVGDGPSTFKPFHESNLSAPEYEAPHYPTAAKPKRSDREIPQDDTSVPPDRRE